MTQEQTIAIVRATCPMITITRKRETSEWRINIIGGKEETACYCETNEDAIGTAQMFFAHMNGRAINER